MILDSKLHNQPLCLALDNADKTNIYKTVKDLVAKNSKNITLVGCILHEAHDWNSIETQQIQHFKDACAFYKVEDSCLIVNDTYQQSSYKNNLMPTFCINFFAVDCFYRLSHLEQEVNPFWNCSAAKSLFLTGKANKYNRVGLLALLKEKNMLDNVEYSFFPTKNNLKETEKIYKQFTTYPFKKFCLKYTSSPDNIKVSDSENGTHYSGYPFDSLIYKNTLFSIIAESEFDGEPIWITEKTYKTIANRHPFIMAGQPNSLRFLKNLGFHTFEEFCHVKNYDEILDNKKRIDAIVQNTKYLKEELYKNRQTVSRLVNENYDNLRSLFEKELESVPYFADNSFFNDFFEMNRIHN